jgi:hypothetical protein
LTDINSVYFALITQRDVTYKLEDEMSRNVEGQTQSVCYAITSHSLLFKEFFINYTIYIQNFNLNFSAGKALGSVDLCVGGLGRESR